MNGRLKWIVGTIVVPAILGLLVYAHSSDMKRVNDCEADVRSLRSGLGGRVSIQENRMTALEVHYNNVDKRLAAIEKSLDGLAAIEKSLDREHDTSRKILEMLRGMKNGRRMGKH